MENIPKRSWLFIKGKPKWTDFLVHLPTSWGHTLPSFLLQFLFLSPLHPFHHCPSSQSWFGIPSGRWSRLLLVQRSQAFISSDIQQTEGILVGSLVFFLLGYGGHGGRRIHSDLHSRRIPLGMMSRTCDRNETALERGTGRTQPWSRQKSWLLVWQWQGSSQKGEGWRS